MLIVHGADSKTPDIYGVTPLQVAKEKGTYIISYIFTFIYTHRKALALKLWCCDERKEGEEDTHNTAKHTHKHLHTYTHAHIAGHVEIMAILES